MSVANLSPGAIRKLGLDALAKALGPAGMVRFLRQFDSGDGDYTRERELWLKDTNVESILKEIKDKR